MKSLLDAPVRDVAWAAVDFESAGAAPGRSDEPVQVGMAVWRGMGIEECFRSFVFSELRITQAARKVHGISDEDVAEAPRMMSLWPEFKSRLARAVVVAHGVGTEKRFLRAFPMHGFGPWIDTLQIARAVLPELPNHALETVVERMGLGGEVRALCPRLDWHDALFDAVACLVFFKAVVEVGGLEGVCVGQLMNMDAAAYRQHRAVRDAARLLGGGEERKC